MDCHATADGETRPAVCDVDGNGLPDTVIGLGSYAGNGGWVHLMSAGDFMGGVGATQLDLNATIGDFNKGVYTKGRHHPWYAGDDFPMFYNFRMIDIEKVSYLIPSK